MTDAPLLAVASGANFIVVTVEDPPTPELLTNPVRASHLRFHDFADRRTLYSEQAGYRVPDNQQQFHPERSVSEQSEEDIDDSKFRVRQRRAVGIVKVGRSDQVSVQNAARRNIAFNDVHTKLSQWSRSPARSSP